MFFFERITKIRPGDRVLEIGPGATPFPRADVLLEMKYGTDDEYMRQCGGIEVGSIDERMVYYDGVKFPFGDKEFDYVICSHVLEHVDDPELFCSEMFRVARAGYVEYPLFYYEYVFDIPEHVNILMRNYSALVYSKKSDVLPAELKSIRRFWFDALTSGYTDTVSHLVPFLMDGFEWTEPFEVRKANSIDELLWTKVDVPKKIVEPRTTFRRILRKSISALVMLVPRKKL